MNWSEIKKAINSDLTKPLNVLIGEILDNALDLIEKEKCIG